MIDGPLNMLSWNVTGLSSRKIGLVKRGRLRAQLRSIHPKPDIVFIQEYKMKQDLCNKMGSLGLRRRQGLWNGAVLNPATSRHRRGTGILLSVALKHSLLDSGIPVEGRAQWIICNIENKKIGFLNIYAPNTGRDRAIFWDAISSTIPEADSWIMGGDYNMVE
jgi:exonuclease III